ncbi:5-formyltetrahydrofolate cyclo-ligase [Carnobacterium funditum]|uniref:5-formyltetrahydrofolate cyclo-ligase n=1 Tax=Carnobacterium funditum TaxID=2752 RepID=UPI00055214FA|nr:5-formyltetrahydrofolate cyclo-ligase [Carnobacterium funditum]
MEKKNIRKKVIKQLNELDVEQKEKQAEVIIKTLFQTSEWSNAKTIAVTMSQDLELDTQVIIEKAWSENKVVVIPRAKKDRKMDFVVYTKDTPIEISSFGLREPIPDLLAISKSEIELIVVPGLAYCESGFRIGFGGGYYDRFLADYKGKTISLVLNEQKINSFKVDSFDIQIDFLITTEKIINTKK